MNLDEMNIAKKYNTESARDWKIERAKEDYIKNKNVYNAIYYRPFDTRKHFILVNKMDLLQW
ncbi:MAG: hypothetical protein IPN94_22780 [Sphingobacteriales bacterium]|nr:hypothetical protein [Sphingobacteriales bacterium]